MLRDAPVREAWKGGRLRAMPLTPSRSFSLVLFTLLCNGR